MRAARRCRLAGLALTASALALLALACAASGDARGFSYGVAAGDVDSDGAILWARASRTGTALAQVSRGRRFDHCDIAHARARFKARVDASEDKTVQKRIGGLAPGTGYHFRFCMRGGAHSTSGSFETAPAPGRRQTIRFALSGDQDAQPLRGSHRPYWNRFQIWNLIRREGNDFNVLLGDTIYSDTEVPGYDVSDVATTVPQQWRKYRLNLGQEPWARARGAASYYAHWGDREFINDFSRSENVFPERGGDVHLDGDAIYKRGLKAFRDYNPVTYSARNGIYRSFRWGRNLEVFFLDERSFRSQSSEYDGSCDNPPGSGRPDLAPTAPQSTRDLFALRVPQLANPVPPACIAKINDPRRTFLGRRQLRKFEAAIERSTATFKVIFSQVPVQQYYTFPYDRWEDVESERQSLLDFLRTRVENAIFLSSGANASLVNDARLRTLGPGGPVSSGITEITTGPIASRTFSGQIEDPELGGPGSAPAFHDLLFEPQPPDGVGMQCAAMDSFSYAEVTVRSKVLEVELKDRRGNPVTDSSDRNDPGDPCGPYTFPAQDRPPAG